MWLFQALKPRLLTYKKKVRKTTSTSASTEIVENEVGREEDSESAPEQAELEQEEEEDEGDVDDEEEVISMYSIMNKDDDNDNYCDDFRGEEGNWNMLFEFSRGI